MTALILILVASLLLFSPTAREAVADLLGVAGIEIRFDPILLKSWVVSSTSARPSPSRRRLRRWTSNCRCQENLGPPDGVFLSDRPSSGRVTMVWESDEALPASGDTGIGVVYSQFALELAEEADFVKSVMPDTSVRAVEVGSVIGLWIEGAPHLDLIRGRRRQSGRGRDEAGRQRADVGERRCHPSPRDDGGPGSHSGAGRLAATGGMR